MKKSLIFIGCVSAAFLLSSCDTTPSADDFSGSWHHLNTFTKKITVIPLVERHIFEPLPVDITVKGLLTRWSKESKLSLRYDYESDFSLSIDAGKIKQPDIYSAISALDKVYASYGVLITINNGHIVATSRAHPDFSTSVTPVKPVDQPHSDSQTGGTGGFAAFPMPMPAPVAPPVKPTTVAPPAKETAPSAAKKSSNAASVDSSTKVSSARLQPSLARKTQQDINN